MHRNLLSREPLIPSNSLVLFLVLTVSLGGCKDLVQNPGLPAGTPDPTFFNDKGGAIGMRNATIYEFEQALPQYIVDVGLLTDEMEDRNTGKNSLMRTGVANPLDERILPEGTDGGRRDYVNLQTVRAFADQAIGALATYDTAAADTATAKMMRGELYALEGYTEILLADLFCSGIPLSTLDFQHDFTYHASSTTAQVYQAALAKFDTALVLADTNTQVQNLARVGRGRAWLDLGQYDSAAVAVTAVSNGFQYQLETLWGSSSAPVYVLGTVGTISDREGGIGFPYRSEGDPRTAVDTIATKDTVNRVVSDLPVPFVFPTKYYSYAKSSGGYVPITVADWIEARLIKAEAELQPSGAPRGPWLATLNQLRASAGLSDTTDPGTAQGRIALLFRERAYWLFLTGHRQGDLRRLIRQYGQQGFKQDQVYPSGAYLAPGTGLYGTDITVPIPRDEYANPLFHGCLSRGV